jgi:hypothetical protein
VDGAGAPGRASIRVLLPEMSMSDAIKSTLVDFRGSLT